MKIKDQVCSLELAKQLKELGVKQDSLFCLNANGNLFYKDNPTKIEGYSAFTDAELEREIFQWIGNQEVLYDFVISFSPTGGVWRDKTFREMYEVQLIDWSGQKESIMERADTGANAKAKMLIHILKNNLIEK